MSAPDNQFGKYELLDRIAAGGMAEIFKARYSPAPGVTKQVVIKKILPHYAANKAFHGMFTNEARIAMGLSHGNIAQVFDFGDIDGDFFLAMELVDGPPLSKVIKRAKALGIPWLPPEFAVFIAIELLKGLHYAHTRLDEDGRPLKIIHRDVSPQNVLLSYEGQVKIVDFGIARARNAGREETEANAVKGKYAYFAPEQARARELDSRTDVFAAGIVLYEMLTGQMPFQGRMMDVLSRIVRGQFPRPRELNPELPAELERVTLKAMALEKSDRYQTAEAFQEDLSRYLASSHPKFTHSQLAQFLQLLFEEELVKDGRPVQLPRELLERAQSWKKTAPQPQQEEEEEEESPSRSLAEESGEAEAPPAWEAPTEAVSLPEPVLAAGAGAAGRTRNERAFIEPAPAWSEAPVKKPFPLVRALLLAVAAIAVGFSAVFVAVRFTRGTLEITSAPPGAAVKIDGKLLEQKTPVQLGGLEGGRAYRVEVEATGFEPWVNDVPLKPRQHLVVDAKLSVIPPKIEPPPAIPDAGVETPKVEAPPPPPPPPDEQTWPVAQFELDVARQHLDLASAGATSVPLDPAQTYRVWLGKGPTLGYGFYVVNPAGAQPGPFGANPLQIKGATRLFAFHLQPSLLGGTGDETKPRQLFLQPAAKKKPTVLSVPASLTVPASTHVTVKGLSPASTYELIVRQGVPAARLRSSGAAVSRVVLVHPVDGLIVAPLDTATRFTKAAAIWLTLVDDAPDLQEGRLAIELREVPRPKRK